MPGVVLNDKSLNIVQSICIKMNQYRIKSVHSDRATDAGRNIEHIEATLKVLHCYRLFIRKPCMRPKNIYLPKYPCVICVAKNAKTGKDCFVSYTSREGRVPRIYTFCTGTLLRIVTLSEAVPGRRVALATRGYDERVMLLLAAP